MHETAIAAKILDHIALRASALDPAGRVTSVSLLVGQFRNVDPESLSFAFDALKKDHPGCADCRLDIIAVEAVALCHASAHRYQVRCEDGYRCDRCGSGIGKLVSGEELDIIDMTIDVTDQAEMRRYARSDQ